MENIITGLLIAYILVGTALAFWAALADKEVKKIVFTNSLMHKVLVTFVIMLWPFLILFYFIFKKEIEKKD